MQTAIDQFHLNIERVRSIGALTKTLNAQTTQALGLSDLLRAEIVLAVSALDHFVHETVRLGLIEAYRNERPRTRSFQNFQVSIGSISGAVSDTPNSDWLEQEIRNSHSHQSFQSYENIAQAISLVSELRLWDKVASHIGSSRQDIRETLRVIINRRNQIAHEADMDPSYPGVRWPIDEQMVDESIDFIEQIAEAIYAVTATNSDNP